MSKWGLKEKLQKMEAFKSTFPVEAGNIAVNHFVKSFRDQGFTDTSRMQWKPRKGGKDPNRAILVKSGALRRSIKRGATSWNRTVIASVGVDYAKIHNEGGVISQKARSGSVNFSRADNGGIRFTKNKRKGVVASSRYSIGARSFKMPKRQFMGSSYVMDKVIVDRMRARVDKIMK